MFFVVVTSFCCFCLCFCFVAADAPMRFPTYELDSFWQPDIEIPLQVTNAFNASYLDIAIPAFMQERSIPGLSVALTYDDRLIYASAFGYAEKEKNELVKTDHRFRQASVSKSITAIAIMHLAEVGALSLSDTVFGNNSILGHQYGSKTFSPYELEITVQHLLEHTTGFVNEDMCGVKKCDPTYEQKYLHLDQWDLVGALLDQYDPSHRPGTFASYSNFAYLIAGRVIEAVSGVKPYEKFVKTAILEPLNITDMEIAFDERKEREVVYYNEQHVTSPYTLTPYTFHISRRDSVGAWIATPISLVKLLTAIDGLSKRSDILNKTTMDLMYQKVSVNGSDYAKGWDRVLLSDGKVTEASKAGGYWGTNSYVNVNFLNKTSYAIVANQVLPDNGPFHSGLDLKTFMDNVTFGIEQWPEWDLFQKY